MPLQIITVPCRTDNYAYILHAPLTGLTAVVDAPEATPIIDTLNERGWQLDFILITHHHNDHIDAVAELRSKYGATVIGAEADAHRLPDLDLRVHNGDTFSLGNVKVNVIDVPGHTLGHIAFHIPSVKALFTADSLMALGCGRLFEGTPAQMLTSLRTLAALPGDTQVYSGHEYATTNAAFALTVEPGNRNLQARAQKIKEARDRGEPTVPSLLSEEKKTNPFLRADSAEIRQVLGMEDAPALEVFTEVRQRRNSF
ncbi:hydroxyacylglutathione hydrolase [Cognatishimia maritima]|uniref:Hydroxyacylglutathione hydrolase n=1 Tax=Cognatishimia maritima TaxID=870908 RepID=A0A1M5L3J8_9RHOB|nr:hydroxyacylglutathione hydrolase [Cognatishimia maritima]SHG58993.1 hydroxyacylglutathione hydrolase [Cognatishimia maritima]